MNSEKGILIVEDDLLSAEYLKGILLKDGHDVLGIVDSGEEAVMVCKERAPDIILMDIMLKGQLSGSEAAVQIKQFHPECKIIFVTAYAETEMIDYAIRSKAYAYLMKPYREKEILATIKVALTHEHMDDSVKENYHIELGKGFFFDTKQCRLFREGKEVSLSEKKLKFIELLAKNKNTTVSNEQICNVIWGQSRSDSTLRSLIHRIRADTGHDMIKNINGVGYTLINHHEDL